MENFAVSLLPCNNYEEEAVLANVRAHFAHLGGVERFVLPGQRVFIKTNMLMPRKPDTVTTTHPSLIKALAMVCIEAGASVVIGDSGGGVYTTSSLENSYRICGYDQIARATGATLNLNTGAKMLAYPEGKLCQEFHFITPYHEADVYINACKLKTHAMTGYTGAVKNNFGLIPGLEKPQMHYHYQKLERFCGMLLDLCLLAKPALTFMDAVMGMEGNGPSGGNPRKIGLTMASTNPFALDFVGTHLIGFRPDEIQTVKQAIDRGISPICLGDIVFPGEEPTAYQILDFKRAETNKITGFSQLSSFLTEPLERLLSPKPKIVMETCVGCGKCEESCPVKAISMVEQKAIINYKTCIRCFCCHEMCPIRSIHIQKFRFPSFRKKT